MNPDLVKLPSYSRPTQSPEIEALMDALICATLERRGPGKYQAELESMLCAWANQEGFLGLETAGVDRVLLSNGDVLSVPTRDVIGLLWSEVLDQEGVTKARRDSVYPASCSWCRLEMRAGDPERPTTHGICPDCRDEMLAGVRRG